jgi:hypothetical protein
MGKIIDVLLPQLPASLVIPTALVLILILMWSRLRQIWQDVLPSYRSYSQEKMRLEILKLRYEIEAIKKSHNLKTIEPPKRELKTIQRRNLGNDTEPVFNRVIYGALGGATISIIKLISVLSTIIANIQTATVYFMAPTIIGAVVGAITLSLFGAMAAFISGSMSRRQAFLIGVAATALAVSALQLIPTTNITPAHSAS